MEDSSPLSSTPNRGAIKSIWPMMPNNSDNTVHFSLGSPVNWWEWGSWCLSLTTIMLGLICYLFAFSSACFMQMDESILGAFMFRILMSSWRIDLLLNRKWPYFSFLSSFVWILSCQILEQWHLIVSWSICLRDLFPSFHHKIPSALCGEIYFFWWQQRDYSCFFIQSTSVFWLGHSDCQSSEVLLEVLYRVLTFCWFCSV